MNVMMLAEVSSARVIGGAERVLRNQALGLAALGHHVEILTRAPDEASEAVVDLNGIREWRYPVNGKHEAAFLWSSINRSVQRFDELRTAEPLDAVVIHQSLAGLGPILSRRRTAVRWIYICHSLAHEEYDTRQAAAHAPLETIRRRANLHARRSVEGVVMSRCHRVVVLSQFMRQRVMAAHNIAAARIGLIPGAVDPHFFTPSPQPSSAKTSLQLPNDRTILFTVRNLVPRMGLENLLCAIEMLVPTHQRLMLVIGGEGPLRAHLQEAIHQKKLDDVVSLVGFVPESRLTEYYQASDLVLMPSLQLEGFGLVMVEALACGTPVLGTPVGAIPEVLNQVDPILVAEGTDGRSIARALERVLARLQDPTEAVRLSQNGRTLIERRYNWTQHCSELARMLDSTASSQIAA
ncbi:MAG: hypothetical protein CV090_06155 [Nitrospira sp. WS238]|nr:hypothetical protein [Nitrospira sp. WS238]